MELTKYHTEIGLPADAQRIEFAAMLRYSPHARQAAQDDRYGVIDLPQVFDSRQADLIEVAYRGQRLHRTLWRQRYDEAHDLSMVIEPDTGRVVTVWLNRNDDKHLSLNRSAYAQP